VEWAKPTWPQAFPAMTAQPTGPFGPRLNLGSVSPHRRWRSVVDRGRGASPVDGEPDRGWRTTRCSPEQASSGVVIGGGEEVGCGADEGSSAQLFGPERDDVARGSSRV
jgi:hypothetical protein